MTPITLYAQSAKIEGGLKILDFPVISAIHYWHRREDRIAWECSVDIPGLYNVKLHYSLAPEMVGGVIAIKTGSSQIYYEAIPTEGWLDFRTFSVGSIELGFTGKVIVSMHAVCLPMITNSAMPDIAWMSLAKNDDIS